MNKFLFLSVAFVLILINCSNQGAPHDDTTDKSSYVVIPENQIATLDRSEFEAYWNQGLAEMTSYELVQGRYGEPRKGKAVLIFVTEPFSRSKQVKLDDPNVAGSDMVDVLKLNMSRKFNTGIYPYSLMSSIFTPYREDLATLKISSSIQEWCGHVFVQANLNEDGYDFKSYSYFESEGDEEFRVENAIAEQDLWNSIRIDPRSLPIGMVEMIPSLEYLRFKHIENKAYTAEISINQGPLNQMVLDIDYSDIDRNLKIYFQKEFPYEIESWEETYVSGWGSNKKSITSTGKRIERRMIDYWNKNSNADDSLRVEFGLE